jgi:spore germination cell wall hydrolase CwlJ-like protein
MTENADRYEVMDDAHILGLCIYREARGEGFLGKRGVGCVVRNRVNAQTYFGHDYKSVILKPYQFSSFNASDPNVNVWPKDGDPVWMDCLSEAYEVLGGCDDLTFGALFYYSPPLVAPPKAWGNVVATAHIGRLDFYKPAPADLSNQGDV